MMSGFQCWADAWGNLHVTGGVVYQPSSGVKINVGSDGGIPAEAPENSGDEFVAVQAALGTVFIGGNGRNLVAAGLTPAVSGPDVPVGFFIPNEPGVYRLGGFTLEVLGSSSATISDDTDVVAELTTGGTAPVGSYPSTSYGATTYNGGVAFTLTITAESGTVVAIPDADLTVSDGTAAEGVLSSVDASTYEVTGDTDWTIVLDPDGSAELRHLTDVIAIRTDGVGWNPAGVYEATALGMSTYNLTADEPVDGEPWTATVRLRTRRPRAGMAYVHIVETAGVLSAVNGPFFGTMPTSATPDFYVPLAVSDGLGNVEQLHTGMLVWPGGSGGGGGVAFVEIDEADYEALGTPDPDTYYDVILP